VVVYWSNCLQSNNECSPEQNIPLGKYSTAFQAEVCGILVCAQLLSTENLWRYALIVRLRLKPRPDNDMQLVAGNLLPVWASCIVWATSCSKLNMFNIAQLVARCDFFLLKQATCCVDKLLILSRHTTRCRQLPATIGQQLAAGNKLHV